MKSICSVAIVLMITGVVSAQKVYTLKQCVDSAINNNLLVKQGGLQVDNAAINYRQAKNNMLPTVSATFNQGINQGRSIDPFTNSYANQNIAYGNYNLSGNFTLFNGAQVRNFIKQNQLEHEATKMELQTQKDNLTLNIILAYLQILNNEDQLSQSRNQVVLTTKQVERLEILNKEGAIIPAQLYELRGTLANDQLAVINNENAVQAAKLALAQLMNVPFDSTLEVERITADNYALSYSADPSTIYNTALNMLSQYKGNELRIQSAETAVKVARSQFYPTIGLGAGLGTNYSSAAAENIFVSSSQVPTTDYVVVNGNNLPVITTKNNYNTRKISYSNQFTNNYSTTLNLGIRIPLLNAFRARNNVALAKNDVKNYEYIAETAKIQLRQNIEQAYFNMTAAYKKYSTLLQQVNDFTTAFKAAEVRYNEGVSTQVDYLIAKTNLDRANINLISAKYDYIFQTKILDYYQGKLVL